MPPPDFDKIALFTMYFEHFNGWNNWGLTSHGGNIGFSDAKNIYENSYYKGLGIDDLPEGAQISAFDNVVNAADSLGLALVAANRTDPTANLTDINGQHMDIYQRNANWFNTGQSRSHMIFYHLIIMLFYGGLGFILGKLL